MTVLQQTSDQMLSTLKVNQTSLKNDSGAIYRIVNKILLPHVDLDIMARSVVGRVAWDNASTEQKEKFKKLFTHQIIKTYSAALSSYHNDKVKFYPIRPGAMTGNRVQVQSEIIRTNGQRIPVSYRLINVNGQWKVYDFSVEEVSIVQSYRSQFSNELSQAGLGGLVQKMQQRYGQ